MLSFKIENFQSIRSASLTIKGFTVLTGENNIGKSATFRAVQALFKNRAGNGFITKGAAYSKVTCHFNGHQLTWDKPTKGSAEYSCLFPGKTIPSVYSKTGRKAPDIIQELGFGDVELKAGTLDPHFSKQREAPFLLSASNQILTEYFSELLKFGPLGKASLEATKDLRKQSNQLKVVEKEIERLDATLRDFPDLDALTSSVSALGDQLEVYTKQENQVQLLQECLNLKQVFETDIPDKHVLLHASYLELDAQYQLRQSMTELLKLKAQTELDVPLIDFSNFKLLEVYFLKLHLLQIDLPAVDDSLLRQCEVLLLRKEYLVLLKGLADMEHKIKEAESAFNDALHELSFCPLCERSA